MRLKQIKMAFKPTSKKHDARKLTKKAVWGLLG